MQHHSATPPNLIEHILALQAIGEAIAQERRAAFERAAETLGIDASVLRRRISRLAKWAGGPLIAGRGQRSQLTARGRDLLARGEDLLIAAQRLLTEDAGQPEMVLPLRVWIEDELDAHRAAAALVADRAAHVETDDAHSVLKQLHAGAADAVILRMIWPPRVRGAQTQRIEPASRVWLVGRADDRRLRKRELRLSELSGIGFSGPSPQTTSGKVLATQLASVDSRIERIATAADHAMAYVSGGHLALVVGVSSPHSASARALDVTRLFDLPPLWLVTR